MSKKYKPRSIAQKMRRTYLAECKKDGVKPISAEDYYAKMKSKIDAIEFSVHKAKMGWKLEPEERLLNSLYGNDGMVDEDADIKKYAKIILIYAARIARIVDPEIGDIIVRRDDCKDNKPKKGKVSKAKK